MCLLGPIEQPWGPSVLRPPPRRQTKPPPSPARPGQPPGGHPARLPTPPHALRRTHRLGTPGGRSLTTYEPGMSTAAESGDPADVLEVTDVGLAAGYSPIDCGLS